MAGPEEVTWRVAPFGTYRDLRLERYRDAGGWRCIISQNGTYGVAMLGPVADKAALDEEIRDWWVALGLNQRPPACEAGALPLS